MRRWIPTLVATAVAVVLAGPALRHWRETPPPPPRPPEPLQSSWSPPDRSTVGGGGDYLFGLALAPDGRQLVFPAATSGAIGLWLHDLRNGETRPLPGTEGAVAPFWSTDGSRIAFFAGGKLRAIDLRASTISDLADAAAPRGGSWNAQGDIVFAPAPGNGLVLRRANGSTAPLTTIERANGETSHAWPVFLPDGKHIVFDVSSSETSRAGIWIATIDDPSARRRLIAVDAQPIVIDHTVLFVSDVSLMAQDLDRETFDASGRSRVIASRVGRGPLGQAYAAAANDVLIYGAPGTALRQLRWMTRDGKAEGWQSEPIDAWDLRVAPDGRRMAVTERDPQFRTLDVVIRTATQPAPTRLSLSADGDESGVWSPDGLRIAWAGQRRKVMIRGAGAVLPEQTIATFETPVQVWDWSRDGRTLLIGRKNGELGDDLWLQPPVEGAAAQPYFTGAFNQVFGAIAPDGKRAAYASDESGQFDIYVDAFPKPAARIRVTTAGGTEPRWSADGRELYFRRGSEIHAATIIGSEVRSITRLFDAGAPIRSYDVSQDGHFLINVPADSTTRAAITLVQGWQSRPRHGNPEALSQQK